MCSKVMLLAVIFISSRFQCFRGGLGGQNIRFYMPVAAAEAAIGLAIRVVLFARRSSSRRRRFVHFRAKIGNAAIYSPLLARRDRVHHPGRRQSLGRGRCAQHHDLGRGDLLRFVLLRAYQHVFEGLGP